MLGYQVPPLGSAKLNGFSFSDGFCHRSSLYHKTLSQINAVKNADKTIFPSFHHQNRKNHLFC